MEYVITLLNFFGITPDKYPFLVLGILMVIGFVVVNGNFNKKMDKLGKRIDHLERTLEKVKLNMKAIITFLATTQENFDPSIIESMSPLQIKPQGYEILNESGFIEIMQNAEMRRKILSYVDDQEPTAKLDVEKYAIVCFNTILEEEFMRPVKTYLYNYPNQRQSFPTLAGLYIRDEYLKEHPEIKE
jgi:hypothetical protein